MPLSREKVQRRASLPQRVSRMLSRSGGKGVTICMIYSVSFLLLLFRTISGRNPEVQPTHHSLSERTHQKGGTGSLSDPLRQRLGDIEKTVDLITKINLEMLEGFSSSPNHSSNNEIDRINIAIEQLQTAIDVLYQLEGEREPVIYQQVATGVPPPPPPPTSSQVKEIKKTRAYNQAVTQLELLLEVKEKMLAIGNVEPDIAKQFKEDIAELKIKIEKHKGK